MTDPNIPENPWKNPHSVPPEPSMTSPESPKFQGFTAPAAPQNSPAAKYGSTAQPQWGTSEQTPPPHDPSQSLPEQAGPWSTTPQDQQWAGAQSWVQAARPGIIPLRPLNIAELFEGTFRAIRSNPVVMFGFSVAIMAVLAFLNAFLNYWFFGSFLNYLENPTGSVDDMLTEVAAGFSHLIVGGIGVQFLTFIATSVLQGILAMSVSEAVLGRLITFGEAWDRMRPHVVSILGATFMVSLISGIPVAFMVLILVICIFIGQFEIWISVLIGIIGVIALLLFMLFLAMRLIYTPTIVAIEGQKVFPALKRSWELTRGAFWATLGRYVLITLAIAAASGVISTVISTFGALLMIVMPPAIAMVVLNFISTLLTAIVIPLTAAYITLMYLDRRMRIEGLATRLAQAASM
ncbi:glycerophosphoryl diester phosphodiesterase membrane domain-containing protein [Schaalia sp. lx-100]|uniref:glycerophosphoryl diester phosphodiesterase membrane domain-containing protein n=1 Tax=Schaalia sp. lx-100 TaxID=2899081 RepID=UPI001E6166BF|nr:glycerophosphoryl diester phosphodiesterase membrane domain-containing protein [Schaalia sp. lx-100]MCD4556743.1 glycerophosphoryl diester phosphodiesterase membrane domain-containing protein [Schaalia sp. lx-100]